VFYLAQVLQLVEHGFNERAPPQKRLIEGRMLYRLHVLAHLGDEHYLLLAQALDQPLGDISLVGPLLLASRSMQLQALRAA
jgi:hypothetical protein